MIVKVVIIHRLAPVIIHGGVASLLVTTVVNYKGDREEWTQWVLKHMEVIILIKDRG